MGRKILLFIISVLVLCSGVNLKSLKLKQVFILSRHNIRIPLASEDKLSVYSPKKWTKRDGKPGYLTQKGALLEGYMGNYFSQWFKSEGFFQDDCPSENTVYVYSNSINRTIATAEAFVDSAFKGCNVNVHHKHTENEEMDPIFNPIILNTTDAYREMVINEINRKLHNKKLKAALTELNNMLDIRHSHICKTESICDLSDLSQINITYTVGDHLWVRGPFYAGVLLTDVFVMNNYDGLPLEDVAWGILKTPEKWEMLTEILRQDQDIRFTTLKKDYAAPLLAYLAKTFINYDNMPKFMLLVGHDCNLNVVFNAMGFKPIRLPNQFETFPIGGKIVFQQWTDGKSDYLKVEYVYASWTQLRNGTRLSLDDPPQRVLLQLKWCNIDKNGMCPWKQFINKLLLQ